MEKSVYEIRPMRRPGHFAVWKNGAPFLSICLGNQYEFRGIENAEKFVANLKTQEVSEECTAATHIGS